jgi:hypothetical protein
MWQGTKVPGHFFVNDAFSDETYKKMSKVERIRLGLERIDDNLKFIEFASSTTKPWLSKFFSMTLAKSPKERKDANSILNELFDENIGAPSVFGQDLVQWVKSKGYGVFDSIYLAKDIAQFEDGYTLGSATKFLLTHSGFQVFDIKVPSHSKIEDMFEEEEEEEE